eukprot:g8774.t1
MFAGIGRNGRLSRLDCVIWVNLPLALVGQVFISIRAYKELVVQSEEPEDFFVGLLFQAWNRTINILRSGGPLPCSYIQSQSRLKLRIASRMRSSQMTAIFCGFAEYVTRAFAAEFPQANVKKSTKCCDCPEQYCSVRMLNPTELFFALIGSFFVKCHHKVCGYENVRFDAIDVFNEMVLI